MKPPFKIEGIYARKMNPEKELVNYKQTKLGNIFNAAIGKKEEAFYSIVSFKELYQKFTFKDDSKEKQFCAEYTFSTGEIFSLADWFKRRHMSDDYKDVIFDNVRCKFVHNKIPFYCYFPNDDILKLKIGDMGDEYLRYVPFIDYY